MKDLARIASESENFLEAVRMEASFERHECDLVCPRHHSCREMENIGFF